ncbi:creatininase family protein [Spiribacter sp. 2438]|uniref:creatininase family protein n=1 Tax=Spiribacter sp. 2438 TaxID=2666185 RepID=UPI001E4671C0|nr:creatininase family protein [Spiribacter sp. 2438]
MMEQRGWAGHTRDGLRHCLDENAVALLPLAAVEQHGDHLPLATDQIIADGVVEAALNRLPAEVTCLRLPTVAIGESTEHVNHAGTLSLSSATFEAVLREIGQSVSRAGARRLVMYTSHGGNLAAMDTAALDLRAREGMLVVKTCHFDFPAIPAMFPEREWQEGLHGGALETALMLHLAPDRVNRHQLSHRPSIEFEALADFRWLGAETRAARFAWLAEDLHPGGITGDARLANPEAGEKLLLHYADTLAGIIAETAKFPLSTFDQA